jgi:hypothetical protein
MAERTLRPFREWHEDHGDVLWWRFPISEAPYVGSPLIIGFTISADLRNQFGEVISTAHADVGGWPFDAKDEPHLFWEPFSVPERPAPTAEQLLDASVHWDLFCDFDEMPVDQDVYLKRLEDAGLAELVPVDDDALEDPFAWERGIEPGGSMYRLTALGRQVRELAKAVSHG